MKILIRKANVDDAKSLFELNEEFNGVNSTTEEFISDALINNHQEIVYIAYEMNRQQDLYVDKFVDLCVIGFAW